MTHRVQHPPQVERDSTTTSFDILDRETCLALLSTTTVGRVAFSGAAGLVLLPVNYRVLDGDVHVRTAATGTLAALADFDGEVLFEVDHHATTSPGGWSVVIRGTSVSVTDAPRLAAPELGGLVPWVSNSSALLLRIRTGVVTGRRAFRQSQDRDQLLRRRKP